MTDDPPVSARTRILDAAETLVRARGVGGALALYGLLLCGVAFTY